MLDSMVWDPGGRPIGPFKKEKLQKKRVLRAWRRRGNRRGFGDLSRRRSITGKLQVQQLPARELPPEENHDPPAVARGGDKDRRHVQDSTSSFTIFLCSSPRIRPIVPHALQHDGFFVSFGNLGWGKRIGGRDDRQQVQQLPARELPPEENHDPPAVARGGELERRQLQVRIAVAARRFTGTFTLPSTFYDEGCEITQ